MQTGLTYLIGLLSRAPDDSDAFTRRLMVLSMAQGRHMRPGRGLFRNRATRRAA